jgi:hypothetical protein
VGAQDGVAERVFGLGADMALQGAKVWEQTAQPSAIWVASVYRID